MVTVNGTIAIGGGEAPGLLYGQIYMVGRTGVFLDSGDYLLAQPKPITVDPITGAFTFDADPLPEGYGYRVRFFGRDFEDRRTVQIDDTTPSTVEYEDLPDIVAAPDADYGRPSWYNEFVDRSQEIIDAESVQDVIVSDLLATPSSLSAIAADEKTAADIETPGSATATALSTSYVAHDGELDGGTP